MTPPDEQDPTSPKPPEVRVRRIHRRDLNRAWEFLKKVFRDVNLETVEYQRPRTKRRFLEVYEEDGVEQLVFEVGTDIVGYAECAFEAVGEDSWVNPRYFEKRDMRPLFVEELATHPDYQGKGVGSFMLDQLQHLARVRGCTHLVLEVAENNENALAWYRKRSFYKLDAAIFMAQRIDSPPELLPPRKLSHKKRKSEAGDEPEEDATPAKKAKAKPAARSRRKRVPLVVKLAPPDAVPALPAASPAGPPPVLAAVPVADDEGETT